MLVYYYYIRRINNIKKMVQIQKENSKLKKDSCFLIFFHQYQPVYLLKHENQENFFQVMLSIYYDQQGHMTKYIKKKNSTNSMLI